MPTILITYSWLKGSLTYTKKKGSYKIEKGVDAEWGNWGWERPRKGNGNSELLDCKRPATKFCYLKSSPMPMLCRGPILTVIIPTPVNTWGLRGNHLVKWWIISAPFSFQWEWTWEQRGLSLWLANATFSSPLRELQRAPAPVPALERKASQLPDPFLKEDTTLLAFRTPFH